MLVRHVTRVRLRPEHARGRQGPRFGLRVCALEALVAHPRGQRGLTPPARLEDGGAVLGEVRKAVHCLAHPVRGGEVAHALEL